MMNKSISFVKWCLVLLLIPKGVLHFSSDQPYHFLVADSAWISPVFGILLLVFGLLASMPNVMLKRGLWIYSFIIPCIILFIQSAASYVKAGFVIEQYLEHSLQLFLPLVLIYLVRSTNLNYNRLYFLLGILVSLTFIGHAIFALGYHYVPEHFVEMTSYSLSINKVQAMQFLKLMGWLDIACATLIFIPFIRKYVMWYLIVWGILTAIARTFYVLGDGITNELLTVNLPNTIYRLPHGLIPVLMLLLLKEIDRQKKDILSRS